MKRFYFNNWFSMRQTMTTIFMLVASFGLAQHNFAPITGPVTVVGLGPETNSLNTAGNSAGVPAGTYGTFSITANWSDVDDTWSSEARIVITTASGSTAEIAPATGGADNGASTTLTFNGNLPSSNYDPSVNGAMDIGFRSTYSGGTYAISNVQVTINGAAPPPPPGECLNTSAFGTATIDTSGALTTISTCAWDGEYSTISGAVAGQTLEFTSTTPSGIITIRSGTSNGPVVASGSSPLTFSNTFTGTLFAHWNLPNCGTASICRTITVQCTSCTPPPPPPAPANDNCANATPIACGGSSSGSTAAATIDGPAASCTGGSIAPDVWYTITGVGQDITASLCGSGYDTKLDVYTGSCGDLTNIGDCNDDSCGLQSEMTFNSIIGVTYYIRVHGFGGSTGNYTLNVSCASPGDVTLRNDFCDTTLTAIGANVFANAVLNFEEYTFEVTAPDNTITEVVRPNRWFNLVTAGLSPNYGATYSVRAKVRVGGVYNNYGAVCTITTPSLSTQLRQDFCNQTLASNGSNIFADAVTLGTAYTFEVTAPDMSVTEVEKNNRWFNLMNDGFMPMADQTYSVRVKVLVNGVYNDYGTACTVTTPGVPSLLNGDMSGLTLSTTVYPNPFTNEFTVRLATVDFATVQLFDINGRLIENRQVQDAFEITMGQELNAGVYLVRVEQNGEVQSFKMIKK